MAGSQQKQECGVGVAMTVTGSTRQEGARGGYIACGAVPPGGVSFKWLLAGLAAAGREHGRRPRTDRWPGCVSLNTRPTLAHSQLAPAHRYRRASTRECGSHHSPGLQSQQRVCVVPVLPACLIAGPARLAKPSGRPACHLGSKTTDIAWGAHESFARFAHLISGMQARCLPMRSMPRRDAHPRHPSASALVSLCRSSWPWPACSSSSLQLFRAAPPSSLHHLARDARLKLQKPPCPLFAPVDIQETLLRGASFNLPSSGLRGLPVASPPAIDQ